MAKNILELSEFYKKCTMFNNVLSTPTLYTMTKAGKKRLWTGHVIVAAVDNSDNWHITCKKEQFDFNSKATNVYYYTSYQLDGGKLTVSAPTSVTAGKNIGRANETTPVQQAIADIKTEFNKKVKSGATENSDVKKMTYQELIMRPQPFAHRVNVMLLHDFSKHENKITYPCFAQPKYDGMHIIATWDPNNKCVDLYSRGTTKKLSQNHLREAFQILEHYPGVYVTGELYEPGFSRQVITSIANQEKDENITHRIGLYVFDAFNIIKDQPFSKRLLLCAEIVEKCNNQYVHMVETTKINDRKELDIYYEKKLDEKYEGIIIRNTDSPYEYGVFTEIRSMFTLKRKPRQDSEFKIIGFKGGKGKMANAIVFIAITESGKQFSVVPSWTIGERQEAFINGESYIGKLATISYDNLSDTGVPVQPVLLFINKD